MRSHETDTPSDPARRARLFSGLSLLVMGLPMMAAGVAVVAVVDVAAAPPALAITAPPAVAEAVDWDHFGEPSLSAARRANVAASRALLPATGAAQKVDTQLYRLPGDAGWEPLLAHYQKGAAPDWKADVATARLDTGNPARYQRFTAASDASERFAVVWLPPAGEVRDGLLMVLHTAPAR